MIDWRHPDGIDKTLEISESDDKHFCCWHSSDEIRRTLNKIWTSNKSGASHPKVVAIGVRRVSILPSRNPSEDIQRNVSFWNTLNRSENTKTTYSIHLSWSGKVFDPRYSWHSVCDSLFFREIWILPMSFLTLEEWFHSGILTFKNAAEL